MKILIIKLGAIGDIVHTLPALAAIRREMPQADISWVAERRSGGILHGNPMIDRLIEVDTRSLRGGKKIDDILIDGVGQVKKVRANSYDISLDFQGLLKSAVIGKLSGAKRRWGFAREHLREPAARFLQTDAASVPERTHVIRKNLALAAQALSIPEPETLEFPIFTAAEHKAEAAAIIDRAEPSFALLNPAGGWVTKLWDAANYGRLADRMWDEFGLTSIVATGPAEGDLARAVMAASRSGKVTSEQPSLHGFYELARSAAVYVGGDTGPTHLAVAARAPVVGIFGPTEWWRNGSPCADDICVERTDADCRVDCHRRTCSNWICMDIDVETVLDAVRLRISRSKNATPVPA